MKSETIQIPWKRPLFVLDTKKKKGKGKEEEMSKKNLDVTPKKTFGRLKGVERGASLKATC